MMSKRKGRGIKVHRVVHRLADAKQAVPIENDLLLVSVRRGIVKSKRSPSR